MATMRGIVFEEKGKPVLRNDLEKPQCGEDRVLIRTMWSGITNGTERNFLMGGNYCPGFPNQAGYQIVGEIVEKGAKVQSYSVGDLVYCGYFLGQVAFVSVPAASDSVVVRLEPGVQPEEAALFGVASVAMHDCREARVSLGQKVLVTGLGVIGQFSVQHSLVMGAVVTASDPDPERRRIANSLGCEYCIDPITEKEAGELAELGPYDVIFEDSGADILPQLIRLLRNRGTLVIVAGRTNVTYPFGRACGEELRILHVNHFVRDDIVQVMRLVQKGKVSVKPLLRDVFRIEDAERVYGVMRDNPSRLFGTVFDWR